MSGLALQGAQNKMTPQRPHGPPKKKIKCLVLGGAGAGKTSILRRYFHGSFQPQRVPTMGSDFYTKRVPEPNDRIRIVNDSDTSNSNPGETANDKREHKSQQPQNYYFMSHDDFSISMQVWDTPGRQRFNASQQPMYTAAFADSFFRAADVAILVYDITSSTSFTQLLEWHADLNERIRRLKASGYRSQPLPILIVANKMDKLEEREQSEQYLKQTSKAVAQRDVMGLKQKDFRGKDFRYEYSASPPSESHATKMAPPRTKRHELSTSYLSTEGKPLYLETLFNGTDVRGSYLDSLLTTEDGSHPDKDMVLLWCMRNGLRHFEVSAKDGTGVETLIHEMIQTALDLQAGKLDGPSSAVPMKASSMETGSTIAEEEYLNQSSTTETNNSIDSDQTGNKHLLTVKRYNPKEDLDLLKRYAPKEESCFPFRPFHWCWTRS